MINPSENNPTGEDPRTSSEIETDIRRTRGRMDATLDELGDRLTARSLVNSALDWWEKRTGGPDSNASAKAKDAYRTVARQVKDHPMPSLLIGAGLAWILVDAAAGDDEDDRGTYSRSRTTRYRPSPAGTPASRYRSTPSLHPLSSGIEQSDVEREESEGPGFADKAKDVAGQAKDAVSGAAESVRDRISGVGDAAQGAVEQTRYAARSVSRSVESSYRTGAERFENAVEQYPLAVGIGFAALGVLAGVLLPRTRREDELLGEHSDQLIDAAKEKGQEVLESGKEVAQRVGTAVADEAQNQGLASKVGEVIQKAKDEATQAAKDEGLHPEQIKGEASSGQERENQPPPVASGEADAPPTPGQTPAY
jgi:ElaB/YqjD/DUF883 family membrane-anchored ribosome-binding protein